MKKQGDIFTAGQPGKKNKSDALDEKAFRLGFLAASIQADRDNLQREKVEAERQIAGAMEQILQAQAQQAMQAQQGVIAGFEAGANMAGPAPGMMPPGGAMPPEGAMPPDGGGPPMPTADQLGFA